MIKKYIIQSRTWIPITSAVQSGSCWINRNIRGNGKVFINHSDSGRPGIRSGYVLFKPPDNRGYLDFASDNIEDIFYARTNSVRNKIEIMVDVN